MALIPSPIPFGVFLAALLLAGPVCAHAFMGRASPPAGAELRTAPATVTIDFTEPVEPHFSTIAVRDAAGKRVDKGAVHPGARPSSIAVDLLPLAPGVYTVVWRAASVDTHRTEGTFTFTVLP